MTDHGDDQRSPLAHEPAEMTDASETSYRALDFADIAVGQTWAEMVHFTEEMLDAFIALSRDHAPAHTSDEHARSMGYQGRLIHGFLVAMPYSRLLGMFLPGALTVLHSMDLQMIAPVHVNDRITYRLSVTRVVPTVRSVKLALEGKNQNGVTVSRGNGMCVYPGTAGP